MLDGTPEIVLHEAPIAERERLGRHPHSGHSGHGSRRARLHMCYSIGLGAAGERAVSGADHIACGAALFHKVSRGHDGCQPPARLGLGLRAITLAPGPRPEAFSDARNAGWHRFIAGWSRSGIPNINLHQLSPHLPPRTRTCCKFRSSAILPAPHPLDLGSNSAIARSKQTAAAPPAGSTPPCTGYPLATNRSRRPL